MAVSLPYLASYKNVGKLFENIASAKVPPKFTNEFLQTTLGLKSSTDRSFIPLLRNMGFLDPSGTPTASYSLLKNNAKRRAAVAAGIRHAYAPLFEADENTHALTTEKLRGLISQVAGTDADMSSRIANTFVALVKQADFSARALEEEQGEKDKDKDKDKDGGKPTKRSTRRLAQRAASKGFAPNFTTTSRYSSPPTEPRRPT
jgi:hypothetical protein